MFRSLSRFGSSVIGRRGVYMAAQEPIRWWGAPPRPIRRRWWRCCAIARALRDYLGPADQVCDALGVEKPKPIFMPTFFFDGGRGSKHNAIPRRLSAVWRRCTRAARCCQMIRRWLYRLPDRRLWRRVVYQVHVPLPLVPGSGCG